MSANSNSPWDAPTTDAYIKIWSKAVDTQMHFNEMSAKTRQLGLTFATAALGLAILMLGDHKDFAITFKIYGYSASLDGAGCVILITAIAVYAVSVLDLFVYHRMLRGAVTFGEDFEENYFKKLVMLDKGMTQAISHYSRHSDAAKKSEGSRYAYTGKNYKTAFEKIKWFYSMTIVALVLMSLLILVTRSSFNPEQAPQVKSNVVKAK